MQEAVIPEDLKRVQGVLEATLFSAIECILRSRDAQTHWGDVRSTALVIWALHEFASTQGGLEEAPELKTVLDDAKTWLVGQAKREEGRLSWDSEGWDTSLAILALTFDDQFCERRDQAAAWLQRIRSPTAGVWYDEVWETVLCSVALLRGECARRGTQQPLTYLFQNVLGWINALPSKQSGEFINPHYSGFIVWLHAEILDSPLRGSLTTSGEFRSFQEKGDATLAWLLQQVASDPSSLWGPYSFSNAYIVYGLWKLARFKYFQLDCTSAVVDWFNRQQGRSGGFEDTEDTAVVILGLTQIVKQLQLRSTRSVDNLIVATPETNCISPKCFIGYSGKSSSIAAEIKDFLSRMMPNVTIRDWKWDFQLGRILFAEIDAASRECSAAIFLITKDDQINRSGSQITSPRDNIVFEVGFFAARIGLTHTILVVEEGTKLPTDWGGILYIPLRDRNSPDTVQVPLLTALQKVAP